MSHVKRNPFEVASLIGAGLVGSALIAGLAWPSDVAGKIPLWFNVSWGVIFIFGALCGLIGSKIQNRATGIVVEQVGLAALGVTCFIGGVTLGIIAHEATMWLVSILFFVLGCACVIQWYRVETTINSIAKKLRRTARV